MDRPYLASDKGVLDLRPELVNSSLRGNIRSGRILRSHLHFLRRQPSACLYPGAAAQYASKANEQHGQADFFVRPSSGIHRARRQVFGRAGAGLAPGIVEDAKQFRPCRLPPARQRLERRGGFGGGVGGGHSQRPVRRARPRDEQNRHRQQTRH